MNISKSYTYAVDSFNKGFHRNPEFTYICKSGYIVHPQQEAINLKTTTTNVGERLIWIEIKNTACGQKKCYICCKVKGYVCVTKQGNYYAQSSCRVFADSDLIHDEFDLIFFNSLEKIIKQDFSRDVSQFRFCKQTEIWVNDDLFDELYSIIINGKKILSSLESTYDSEMAWNV